MTYRYKPWKAVPNANHFKAAGTPPQPHTCTCRFCQTPYLGHGAKCPACVKKDEDARLLAIAEANASVETREMNNA